MHESRRKAMCRLAFVGLCAGPTLVVMAVIVLTWTPWYHAYQKSALEIALSQRLGIQVQIQDFANPAPGLIRLDQVTLLESETGANICQVKTISYSDRGNKRLLQLQQTEVQSAQLRYVWKIVHDRFLCQPDATDKPFLIGADDLTLQGSTSKTTLTGTLIQVTPTENRVTARVEFYPAGRLDRDGATRIEIVRDRGQAAPSTRWELYSGKSPLPCSALSDYLPMMRRLGADARFAGRLRWTLKPDEWSIDLGGAYFDQVDLAPLFETLPHKLTGLAELKFYSCEFDSKSKQVNISGHFAAVEGYIGQSLLDAAVKHLSATRPKAAERVADTGVHWYDQMSLRFRINGPQLTLFGDCHSHVSGAVLVREGQPLLLRQNNDATIPAAALALALAPPHAVTIPLSRQTTLMQYWIVPPEQPIPTQGNSASPNISSAPRSNR